MTARRFHDGRAARLRAVEGLPLATFGARAGALIIDGVLLLALVLTVRLPLAMLSLPPGAGPVRVVFDLERLWDLLALITYFSLFTWLTGGQTPGKRLLGIRVVSLTHERLTLWQCIERALGYVASTLELGFGFLQYYLHPNRQTVHDRIAETIVVRTGPSLISAGTPPAPSYRGKRRRHRRKL